MAAKIEIQVGADVNGVLSAMNKASKSLADFQAQAGRFKSMLATATDPAAILRLNKAIEATDARMKAIQTSGLGAGSGLQSLQRNSNSAGIALSNLGRIAQDAPFGFLGISNNLNPLLESFQRLRAESGSTSTALKSLGSSLLGAGGIGIAISVISSLLVVFGDKLFAGKKEIDATSLSLINFTDVIADAKAGLEAFNKEAEFDLKTFGANVDARFGKGFQADLLKGKAAFIATGEEIVKTEEEAAKLYENQTAAFKNFLDNASSGALKLASEVNNNLSKIPSALLEGLSESDKGIIKAAIDAQKALTETQIKLNDLRKQQEANGATNRSLVAEEQRASEERAKKDAERIKNLETVQTVLAALGRELDVITKKEIAFGLRLTPERVQTIKSTIVELFKKFQLDPQDVRVQDLVLKVDNLNAASQVQELIKKDLEDPGTIGSGLQITVPANVKLKTNTESLSKTFEELELNLQPYLQNLGSNIGEGIGSAIGDALSNNGGFENVFDGLAKTLASGLKEMGKLLIQIGVQMLITKKALEALKVNPYLAIVAGIALVALGQAAQNSFNKKKAFAQGGIVPGVGNSDSVDALLTPGEFVIKKSAVQNIGRANLSLLNNGLMPVGSISPGMQTVQIVGEEMISGENIYIAYKRYEARRGRST